MKPATLLLEPHKAPEIESKFVTRLASPEDTFAIMKLYADAYHGSYSDPLMSRYELLQKFLEHPNHYWLIAELKNKIIASVVIRYDPTNQIAKAFGAVVRDEFRRHLVMESLLSFGIEYVKQKTDGVDLIYATTRTVHEGAQALTEKLGFKKLGIFPNSHKTSEFETHCLAALFLEGTFKKRYGEYKLHATLKPLFELVMQEIPGLTMPETIVPDLPSKVLVSPKVLELIESEHFVKYRYHLLKSEHALQFAFFPFHEPNVMIISPDQSIELFCYLSRTDGYSVIIGGKVNDNTNFTHLFEDVTTLLREHHARYVELLVRADKPKIIDSILKSKFIPSAFFPAFQLHHGKRYDYVVMSKTFELFDFQNIKLKGLNQKFLEAYFTQWKSTALNPKLMV